jgi:NitT/TauT family transport system ATP-binding protein
MPTVPLRLIAVHRTFPGGVEAVAGVDLTVASGTLVALVGPSGCGKTTLLRIAGGLDQATSGNVERAADARHLGFCFQEPRLLPWRSVAANVELPLELARVPRAARREAAARAIALVGLEEAATRLPRALSGGMRMRAALARAIVARPGLLLLDEPFGALDEVTRSVLDEELDRLRRHESITALLITHSIQEAVFLADEVVVLTPRPARVVERFRIPFADRDAELRSSEAFALLVARVHGALRRGMAQVAA